jgi:type I site-specific restriction endonuclease
VNEADTCRKFVVPLLQAAGWDDEPHAIAEQRSVTDGRIVPAGKGFLRRPPKRVDYLLKATRDFALAVVEAKAGWKSAADGVQQARDYAELLGLKFAYATNGHEIIEIDYNQDMKALVPKVGLTGEYLCAWLWCHNADVLRLVEKSTHDTRKLETAKLASIAIPLPPVAEQRCIVAELDALRREVDALRAAHATRRAELDALLPAILDRAFAGAL